MNLDFWNLFWTTGMPEAWLMSREGKASPPPGSAQENGTPPYGPLTGFQPRLSDNSPGGPEKLY